MKECSKHGGTGNPDCNECWAKLGELLGATDPESEVYISTDQDTKEKLNQ